MGETLFDRMGGMRFFEDLVGRFYAGVASDPVLRPLYPGDLEGARHRLTLFLAQYFGGPRDYEAERGAPMLRMRHRQFAIDGDARNRWVAHMDAALASADLTPDDRAVLRDYFSSTASFLINRGGLSLIG